MSTNLFGTHGSCTCGFADVPPELPCAVHPPLCDCGKPVAERDEFQERCEACLTTHEENQAEAAYERQQEEPCFRGGEYAAHLAHEMEQARRLK